GTAADCRELLVDAGEGVRCQVSGCRKRAVSCQLSALRKPGVTFGITAYGITGSIRNLRRVVALAAGTKFGTQAGAIDGKLQESSRMGGISTTPLMNCHPDP